MTANYRSYSTKIQASMLSFQQPQQVCCAAEDCTCILHFNSKPQKLLIVTRPKGIANDASARPTNLSSASYDLAI